MQLHVHPTKPAHATATKAEMRRQQVEFIANPLLRDSWVGIDVFLPGQCPCAAATPKENDRD